MRRLKMMTVAAVAATAATAAALAAPASAAVPGHGSPPAGAAFRYGGHEHRCVQGEPGFSASFVLIRQRAHPVDLVHSIATLTATDCIVAEVTATSTLEFKSTRLYSPGHWVTAGEDTISITLPSPGEKFNIPVTVPCDAVTSGTHLWRIHLTGAGTFPDGSPTGVDLYMPSPEGKFVTCYLHETCPRLNKDALRITAGLSLVPAPPNGFGHVVMGTVHVRPLRCPPLQGRVDIKVQRRNASGRWVTKGAGDVSLDGMLPDGHPRSGSAEARCTRGHWRMIYDVHGVLFDGKRFEERTAYVPKKSGRFLDC